MQAVLSVFSIDFFEKVKKLVMLIFSGHAFSANRTRISPFIFCFVFKIELVGLKRVQIRSEILQQKIKQDINGNIGKNIRKIRIANGIGQTELVRLLDLQGIPITRECLVKIERGIQHIQMQQLRAIKEELNTTYDELLK